MWQDWRMFAPNPFREVPTLEAEVRDAQGARHRFAFPSMAGQPPWRTIGSFRHPKYAHNAMNDDSPGYREFAARYAVRRLNLPSSTYPVEARLFHRVRPIPPPGGPGPFPGEVKQVDRGTYAIRSLVENAP
jgi:hypothetical protein